MSSVDTGRPLQWEAAPVVPPAGFPEPFWRPLFFFNAYRLIVGLLLLTIVAIWGNTLWFGSHDMTLFVVTGIAYVLFSIGCFVLISARWRLDSRRALRSSPVTVCLNRSTMFGSKIVPL